MKYVTIRAIRENDIGLLEKIVRGMTGIHKGFTVEPLNIVIFHEFSKKLRRYFLEISECQTDMWQLILGTPVKLSFFNEAKSFLNDTASSFLWTHEISDKFLLCSFTRESRTFHKKISYEWFCTVLAIHIGMQFEHQIDGVMMMHDGSEYCDSYFREILQLWKQQEWYQVDFPSFLLKSLRNFEGVSRKIHKKFRENSSKFSPCGSWRITLTHPPLWTDPEVSRKISRSPAMMLKIPTRCLNIPWILWKKLLQKKSHLRWVFEFFGQVHSEVHYFCLGCAQSCKLEFLHGFAAGTKAVVAQPWEEIQT